MPKHLSDEQFLRALDRRFNTIASWLDYRTTGLSTAQQAGFPLKPSTETAQAICTLYPDMQSKIIAAADHARAHGFDLLGSGPTHLGERMDWHLDFTTGYRFDPRQYYADVRQAPFPGGYEIKVPWELSRCQHFAWLGQAYTLTGDDKYTQAFVDQVDSWIQSNPWPWGVNWTCTMDVAIRAVNWLWGYAYLGHSPVLSDGFRLAFYKNLLIHGRHIMHNLENQGEHTGNHYLSNLVGLVYLGLLCPEFREARQWREFGLAQLEQEMVSQVYADGANFEASTSYHRLVLEMLLSATLLARSHGHEFGPGYRQRLEKMAEVVMALTKPDGTTPLLGDADNGRLHRLKVWDPPEREWTDFRYLLAIAAVLFRREDFAQAAEDQWEEAFWLLGEEALTFRQEVEARPLPALQRTSQTFPDVGWYVMRHDDHYLAIVAGPNGQHDNGSHAHNHSLSFELCTGGQTWILDPGSYVYTVDYAARNRYRSTAFHNTVVVDGQEQNPISPAEWDVFRLPDVAQARVKHWSTTDGYTLFTGVHQGYARLQPPVMHERTVFFDRSLAVWIIHDRLLGRTQQPAVGYLHFTPGLRLQLMDGTEPEIRLRVDNGSRVLRIAGLLGTALPPTLYYGTVSRGYGVEQPAPVVVWEWERESSEFLLALTVGPYSIEDGEDIENREGDPRMAAAYQRYREVLKHGMD